MNAEILDQEDLKQFHLVQDSTQTSLSKNVVKFLLFELDDISTLKDCLTDDEPKMLRMDVFSLDNLTKGLSKEEIEYPDILLVHAGKFVQQYIPTIHSYLASIKDVAVYSKHFGLISEKASEIYEYAWKHHQSNNSLFAFEFFVPFIERNLQQILFQYWQWKLEGSGKDINIEALDDEIPTKLTELLEHKDVHFLFGKDLCFLFTLLIGPLHGVNLRNVCIHGFMSKKEWIDGYTSLILMIAFSIGPMCDKLRSQYPIKNPSRPCFEECIGDYKKPLLDLKSLDFDAVSSVLARSLFVLAPWRETWISAIQCMQSGEYYSALVHLFPIIEHAIRRIYVCANNCAERLLTAEQKSLYTTLDILLAEEMMFNEGREKNLIFDELGILYQNILYDMFLWTDCPRLRDMLSHGGCDPFKIKKEHADYVLSIGLAMIIHYDIQNDASPEYFDGLPSIFKESFLFFRDKYEPIYHPKSVAERIVRTSRNVIVDFDQVFEFPVNIEDKYRDYVKEVEAEVAILSEEVFKILVKSTDHFKVRRNDLYCSNRNIVIYGVLMSEKEMRKAVKIRELITFCVESLDSIKSTHKSLCDIIIGRKSTTQNRKHVSHIIAYAKCLSEFFKVIHRLAEYEMMIQDEDPEFFNKLYNIVGSICGSIKKNTYRGAFETLAAFLIPPQRVDAIKFLVQHKKYVEKTYGDLQKYKYIEPKL